MSTTLPLAPTTRFHLSLNVSNLERSVKFYQMLFGQQPAKQRGDYAKFELDDPAVVLSLEVHPHQAGGALNHLGFRLPDEQRLTAMHQRMKAAGFEVQREEKVECCYAKQTKFWVTDPDRTLWEFYTFDGDIEHRGEGQTLEAITNDTSWEHRLGEPVPARLPFADGALDEVRLRGSFNIELDDVTKMRLLKESARVLRHGGRLFVHVLVADRQLETEPRLPGPAAAVRHVPLRDDVERVVEAAGFCRLNRVKYGSQPCFVQSGVELRELQLESFCPTS